MRASFSYFALVFAAGFVLGVVRTSVLVPRIGVRMAELSEMPFMLVVIFVAARYVSAWFNLPAKATVRLGVGLLALACLMATELLLALLLQNLTPAQYLATRDPVSGSVYLGMLGLFALMPALIARRASA